MTGVKSETQKSESNGEFPVIFANESEIPCGRKKRRKIRNNSNRFNINYESDCFATGLMCWTRLEFTHDKAQRNSLKFHSTLRK
jgi:hypothetical protein